MIAKLAPGGAAARQAGPAAAFAFLVAVVALVTGGWGSARPVGIGVLIAASLVVDIQLPRRGSIPLGHAVVIAVAAQVAPRHYAVAAAVAVALLPAVYTLRGRPTTLPDLLRPAAAVAAAGVTAAVLLAQVPAQGEHGWARGALLVVLVTGVVYLTTDLVFTPRTGRRATPWRDAYPIHLSLLCSAALLAMASGWMLVFAALPLFMTKFSFERYSAARRTYEQTIQALGIVPELAGHVGLGHGERTAFYAAALAEALEFTPATCEYVATAARLHHVGHVAVPDLDGTPPSVEDALVASTSAHILRESGFPPEIADLVSALGDPEGAADSLPQAVLRVATTFDDLVGEDASRTRGALAILGGQSGTPTWITVTGALRSLVDEDPALVRAAVAEGEPLVAAAAAAAEQPAA